MAVSSGHGAHAAFAAELPLQDDVRFRAVERVPSRVRVAWSDGAGARDDTFDWALSAVGRVPNVDTLRLDQAGLALDRRGVPLHDPGTLQCWDAPSFIAGDAAADRPLLQEAADEGRIAGTNAGRWPAVVPGLRRCPLSVVFSSLARGTPSCPRGPSRLALGTSGTRGAAA